MTKKQKKNLFLSLQDSSNEFFVGTAQGVFKASQIKIVPESERLEKEWLEALAGFPWQMQPNADSDMSNALPAVVVIPASTDESVPAAPIPEATPR